MINSVIDNNTAASTLTKVGSGKVTLNGVNIYTGGTTVTAGTLQLGDAGALGTGTLTLNGGNLDSSVVNLVNANNTVQAWNADFTFVGSQNLDLGTGSVTFSANRQATVTAGTLTVGGAIGGSFNLTKAGAGTLVLSGNNSASTGATSISGGTLVAAHVSALNITGSVAISTTTGAGTLRLATDTSVDAFPITSSSNNPGTIISDRATAGAGITHLLGAAVLGANTYSFQAGSNVTSGTAVVSLASVNVASGSAGTATLNPTTASVLIPGAVNIAPGGRSILH